MSVLLPEQFPTLNPYAEKWAIDSEEKRRIMRMNSSQSELQSFYQTMKPILDEVIQYLNQFNLDELADAERHLLQMSLSLVEISVAVELFRNPWPLNAWPWEKFSVSH